jgi:hypothetical protein
LFIDKPKRKKKMINFLSEMGSVLVCLHLSLTDSPLLLEIKFLVKIWCLLWRCQTKESPNFLRCHVSAFCCALQAGSFRLPLNKKTQKTKKKKKTKRSYSAVVSSDSPDAATASEDVFSNINIPKLRQVLHVVFNLLDLHGFHILATGLAVEKMHQKPKKMLNHHSNNLQRQHASELKRMLVQRKLAYLMNGGFWGKEWTSCAGPKALGFLKRVSQHRSFGALLPSDLRGDPAAVHQTNASSTCSISKGDSFYSSPCLFQHLLPFLREMSIIYATDHINTSAAWFEAVSSSLLFASRVKSVQHRDRSFSFYLFWVRKMNPLPYSRNISFFLELMIPRLLFLFLPHILLDDTIEMVPLQESLFSSLVRLESYIWKVLIKDPRVLSMIAGLLTSMICPAVHMESFLHLQSCVKVCLCDNKPIHFVFFHQTLIRQV